MARFQSAIDTLRRTESELEDQLNSVRAAIAALTGGGATTRRGRRKGSRTGQGTRRRGRPRGRRMSAAARKRISDAQKARWAKQRAEKR